MKIYDNHMGSLITSRETLLQPILEIAKERDFFVLDSLTAGDSKMIPLAQSMGIAHIARDVFLDDVKTEEAIKKQLSLLAEKALSYGNAVAIGHVGVNGEKMARALKEMIPEMEAQGIEFVYLSDLVY